MENQISSPPRESFKSTSPISPKTYERLYSLDALRGFDMVWIMGAEEIFHTMARATKSPFWEAIADQFTHPAWNGFHLYDLIFPMFLFIAGVSSPYSIGRDLEAGITRNQILWKVIKRAFILILLGLVVNNGLNIMPIREIRFGSVLGRIGLAYMFANIFFIYTKQRTQIIAFFGFILFYWLLLKFTSAPGFAPGNLTMEGNFASYIDRLVLPGKLYLKIHDPEGLASTLPAISTGLLGILTGSVLRNGNQTKTRKAVLMGLTGIIFILVAQIWNLDFPINKNLWTSSFVLQVGGLSLILLSIFYYIIDVLGYRKWAFFFKVIGMNSILIYLSGHFIEWEYTTNSLFGWLGQLIGNPFNAVILSMAYVMVKWGFLYFLYQKKVFLKV